MEVIVRMRVKKILTEEGYQKAPDGSVPPKKTIHFEVSNTSDTNSPNYPYSFWSGGTVFPLMTINEEASKHFEIGKEYNIKITPAE